MEIFSLQIQTIKELLDWRVSLDIMLITLLIFFLYRTLRATGTGKIFMGIMIAAAIFIMARLLDLKGIEWIYSNLSPIFLLAIIIIFQPEIRKIFERAASIRRREISTEAPKLSSLICDAVFTLVKQRRGALLVFPGQDSVKAWTSEGIQIDAQPSYPLLMSIFDPNSPGHDGAVVIENGKVSSFAVRLPLSESEKLSEEFGTRHHAGLGLSEVTDALVVAVSEERGTVTLFYEGTVERIKDKNELAARVMKHWTHIASYQLFNQGNITQRKTIRQIVMSFVLAFLFWSTVVLTQSELREISYTVPIEYLSATKKLTVVGEKPSEMNLNLVGTASELDHINPMQLRAHIDLSKLSPGENIISITEEHVALPKHIKLLATNPPSLKINITKLREVEAIIKPQLIGSLPKGKKIRKIELKPETINVFAPIDSNEQGEIVLWTTPIYLENVKQDVTLFCKLIVASNIQALDRDLPDVEINISIE
ncbi:MAG: diadenylate cyclase [bacterium]|nr:MAG: diadenylate cyclase [bacterium]